MGGRKSYTTDRVVGKSDKLKPQKQALAQAILSEDPKRIVSSAVNLLSSSDVAIGNLATAVKLLDFISENKKRPPLSYQERKELVSKEWAKIKKTDDLKTSSTIDKLLIESATKVIRRGKNE